VLSPRLSDLPSAPPASSLQPPKLAPAPKPLPAPRQGGLPDAALQTQAGPRLAIQPKTSFGGIGENGYIPPDPNIAVGPTQIVQVVNSEVAVFDKSSGALLSGPSTLSSLWSGLAGCSSSNSGDPIVQYDAGLNTPDGTGRWLITELGSTSAPYYECIAVSTTSDATGTYYLYADTQFGNNLNDYPKFGMWPTASNSAYLATYNLFQNAQTFIGAELCAYDRIGMRSGAGAPTPAAICYTIPNDGGYLPSDLDGATPPADTTPGYFLNFQSTTLSSLRLYELGPDFTNLSNSKLTQASPDITVASFSEACGGGTCIPQPNKQQLDSLGDRLMYRLAYRMLSQNGSVVPTMVVNHSVTAGSSVGVRWYELQATNGIFGVAQQGTYAPDSAYRWMGSAAMDGAGDIAVGYSESSGSIYPQIVFTGRTPTMTANTMGAETVLQPGSGAQTNYSRWGDYTALRIDPSDDSTFWYTNEYYTKNSRLFNYQWSTIIGSFTLASSGGGGGNTGPDFTLSLSSSSLTVTRGSSNTLTVTATATSGAPSVSLSAGGLPKATSASFSPNPVTATGSSTLTVKANRNAPTGVYTVTVTGNDNSGSQSATLTLTIQ
jgi:hypothetical protein